MNNLQQGIAQQVYRDRFVDSTENTFDISVNGVSAGATVNFELKAYRGTWIEINWGDGNSETLSNTTGLTEVSHTYSSADDYTVRISKAYNLEELRYEQTSQSIAFGLSDLPPNLTYLLITALADAPSGLTYLNITGSNTISDYTSGHVWASSITYLECLPAAGYGLSSTEVDNLLIDLDDSGMSSGTIDISGNNAARTSASDSAVTSLEAEGVTVTTN